MPEKGTTLDASLEKFSDLVEIRESGKFVRCERHCEGLCFERNVDGLHDSASCLEDHQIDSIIAHHNVWPQLRAVLEAVRPADSAEWDETRCRVCGLITQGSLSAGRGIDHTVWCPWPALEAAMQAEVDRETD